MRFFLFCVDVAVLCDRSVGAFGRKQQPYRQADDLQAGGHMGQSRRLDAFVGSSAVRIGRSYRYIGKTG